MMTIRTHLMFNNVAYFLSNKKYLKIVARVMFAFGAWQTRILPLQRNNLFKLNVCACSDLNQLISEQL